MASPGHAGIAISVADVETLEQPSISFHIDQPTPGSGAWGVMDINGWAYEHQGELSAVEVLHGGTCVATAPVRMPRPDVAAVHRAAPPESGFAVGVPALTIDPRFTLSVRAVRADGSRADLAVIKGRRTSFTSDYEPRFQPLMITSLGRTGSTWLMQLLSAHPELVAYRTYPYEIRPASYWLQLARVLTQPTKAGDYVVPEDPILAGGHRFVGPNPYYAQPLVSHAAIRDWFAVGYSERVRDFCLSSIDELYGRIAEAQQQADAGYWVEKMPVPQLAEIASSLHADAREILLVRDFRDVIASMLAFNEKRGSRGFEADASSGAGFVESVAESARVLVAAYERRGDRARLVRYEDLVSQTEVVLAEIVDFLGVDNDKSTLASMLRAGDVSTPALDAHRTSPTTSASIGRWRRDLSIEMQRECNAAFADLLAAFGYAAA